MEFKEIKTEVDKIGDIESSEVSIDAKNINFITTILSTNLYSNPVTSFVREIVSNAWDSHVEAGVDEPVILEIGEDTEGNYYCRIQDFGVGLSEERFNDIYKNIGSSTKRGSNEQIGGFGIGRFSALAVSDMVNITSVYNGKIYKYLMYKDGMKIVIDKLFEDITDERNGVEVRVPIENESMLNQFSNAIQDQLVYFENVYFVNNVKDKLDILEDKFNNYKIKTFKNFKVNNMHNNGVDLILGKVRYPLRFYNLNGTYTYYQRDLPISIIFNIGELEVSPTREEILYSKANIKTIEDKLKLAFEEVEGIIAENSTKDFTKISDYLSQIREPNKITVLTSSHPSLYDVELRTSTRVRNYTLNGVLYNESDFINIYDFMFNYKGLTTSYVYYWDNERIKYERVNYSLSDIKKNINNCYLADLSNVKNITKTYIRKEFKFNSFFFNYGKDTNLKKIFAEYKEKYVITYLSSKNKFNYKVFKFIYLHFVKNVSRLKHINDDVIPKQWILDYKEEQRLKRKNAKRNVIDRSKKLYIYQLRQSMKGKTIVADSKLMTIRDIENTFGKIIYVDKNDDSIKKWYNVFSNAYHTLVQISPTYMKVLKNLDNCIEFKDFMKTEQRLIRNIGTAMYILKKVPFIENMSNIENLKDISQNLSEIVYTLNNFVSKQIGHFYSSKVRNELYQEIYEICEKDGYFNFEMKGLVDGNIDMLLKSKVLIAMSDNKYGSRREIPQERLPFVIDYILSRKLFRPRYQIVLESKKLINNIS